MIGPLTAQTTKARESTKLNSAFDEKCLGRTQMIHPMYRNLAACSNRRLPVPFMNVIECKVAEPYCRVYNKLRYLFHSKASSSHNEIYFSSRIKQTQSQRASHSRQSEGRQYVGRPRIRALLRRGEVMSHDAVLGDQRKSLHAH